jgi:formylglycine-generating enzyme required for sulfatase activity
MSRRVFAIPVEDAYYDRPIPLRNPIVFYEGHLPAFNINTLMKIALKCHGIDERYEVLFARGIDPDSVDAVKSPTDLWPSRAEVQAYGARADGVIEDALLHGPIETNNAEAAFTILEHEQMHQETLMYMFHEMDYARKVDSWRLAVGSLSSANRQLPTVNIPAGIATLGNAAAFGWDNEFPQHQVEVAAFAIDAHSVTNGDYLDYMRATDAEPPHFWLRRDGAWFWRGMFELVPLPLDWPVWVSHDEAAAYARWRGGRLPSEGEYHRAAFGAPDGSERLHPWGDEPPDATCGNFGFTHWDPVPVGSYPAGASAWGVHDLVGNGWEWTSTVFDGFAGFAPMLSYPNYSADFFDGQHYVLKGASPATCHELIRRSFRNWFRPNYPYVYAKFRCVV